jgi:hypothetical protein
VRLRDLVYTYIYSRQIIDIFFWDGVSTFVGSLVGTFPYRTLWIIDLGVELDDKVILVPELQ